MASDYKALLYGLLTTAHKRSNEEIDSLILEESGELKEEGLNVLLDLDKSRIKPFIDAKTENYNRGKRETMESFEKDLKTSFGIESELKGMELFDYIVKEKTKNSEVDPKNTLTEEDVLKHPAYQKLKLDSEKNVSDLTTSYEGKIKTIQGEYQRQSSLNEAWDFSLPIIESLNLSLSTDPVKKANQLGVIKAQLTNHELEKQGDDFAVKRDGKLVNDEHGNTLMLSDMVKGLATSYYDIAESTTTTTTQTSNRNGNSSTVVAPSDLDELEKAVDSASSQEERQAIYNAYQEKNKN